MEPIGSHYAVILHDPELRRTVVEEWDRARSGQASRTGIRLRNRLAQALHSLASHAERRERAVGLARPQQPVAAR
jgi:hypothetical protein